MKGGGAGVRHKSEALRDHFGLSAPSRAASAFRALYAVICRWRSGTGQELPRMNSQLATGTAHKACRQHKSTTAR